MANAVQFVRILSQVGFVALGLLAVRELRRNRQPAALWLAATFGLLAVVVLTSLALPEDETRGAVFWIRKIDVAALVVFPYLLYRFMGTFEDPRRVERWIVETLTAAVVVWSLALPSVPATGAPRPLSFQVFLAGLLLQWTVLSLLVVVRLWRAGRGQPTVARLRMRMLSLGSLALNLALVLSGVGGNDPASALTFVVQSIAVASGVLFFLGFAPPAILRAAWRREEEADLRRAEARLMSVVSPAEVGAALLPHVSRVLGGNAAALIDREGRLIAEHGMTLADALRFGARRQELAPSDPVAIDGGVATVPLQVGLLLVQSSPYAPFFGREELELLTSLGFLADIAIQRTQLFESERTAREEAERVSEELESFVYSVSHDLKSPLISVLSYLDFLRSDYGDLLDDQGKHYLDRMSFSMAYMNALIGDILELSRIGRVDSEPEQVRLQQLIGDVAETVRLQRPNLTIEVGDLPDIWMPSVRSRQLFLNLLSNAAEHGGRDDLRIRVDAEREPTGAVVVSVSDDGRGIPKEYREKVFGVFERLTTDRPSAETGTGIGLAICKKIVEGAGGTIWIAEAPVGATVCVRLPHDRVVSTSTKVSGL